MARKGKPTQADGFCGAKTPKGKHHTCHNKAVYKTDHVGKGRCWKHGGLTPLKKGGIFSTVIHEQYQGVYQDMLGQKETLASVDEEIAFLRVCTMRIAAGAEALLDPKQREKAKAIGLELGILDSHASRTLALTEILERTTRAIKRKVDIEQGIAIRLTPAQITQFVETFKSIVTRHVMDTKAITAIGRALSTAFGGDGTGQGTTKSSSRS